MHNNFVPVYLDCNYDALEKVKNQLDKLSEVNDITSYEISGVYTKVTDELRNRYGAGSISGANIHLMSSMVKRISNGISYAVNNVKNCDYESRERFRDYVLKALNYTKPIDREDYPHLSDETIEKVYDYILSGNSSILNFYGKDFVYDKEEAKEVLKLILANNVGEISYIQFETIYKNMNIDERNEIYKLLNGVDIHMSTKGDFSVYYIMNSEEFKSFGETLLSNSLYDEETLIFIYGAVNHASYRQRGSAPCIANLKFGDLEIDIEWDSLKQYGCNNFFDYCGFFKDNLKSNTLEGNVVFPLNGLDCSIEYNKLKDVISLIDIKGKTTQGLNLKSLNLPINEYQEIDMNSLTFIKYLINANAFSTEKMNEKNNIRVLGKNISISLNELNNCYDENNTFDVEKLIKNVKLSESSFVYYNNYVKGLLTIDNLNVVAKNKAIDFFNQHGSVNQGGIKNYLMSPGHYQKYIDELLEFGSSTYGLKEDDVYVILNSIDTDRGACTYADACNLIYELYDYDDEKFKNDFGYSILNEYGKINGDKLLLDLFINTNIGSDGNSLITKKADGTLEINKNLLIGDRVDVNEQKYIDYIHDNYNGIDYINDFLKSKGNNMLDDYSINNINVNYSSSTGHISYDSYEKLVDAINNGNPVTMTLVNDWQSYELNSTNSKRTSESHAVTAVGVTEEGVIVRTWGREAYIPWDSVGMYSIYTKE